MSYEKLIITKHYISLFSLQGELEKLGIMAAGPRKVRELADVPFETYVLKWVEIGYIGIRPYIVNKKNSWKGN